MRLFFAVAGLLALFAPGAAQADTIGNAYAVCHALKKTGYVTECDVSVHVAENTVSAVIDTNSDQARQICSAIAQKAGHFFADTRKPWELLILSPYSGSHPIARCNLN